MVQISKVHNDRPSPWLCICPFLVFDFRITGLFGPGTVGGVAPGRPEGNQLLPQSEAAHHWGGGEHERFRVPQVQGEGAARGWTH